MHFEEWLLVTYGVMEPKRGWCTQCGEEDVELVADDRCRGCLRYLQGYDEGEANARAELRAAIATVTAA